MSIRYTNLIAIARCAVPIILLFDLGAFAVYLIYRLHVLESSLADILLLFVILPMAAISLCMFVEKVAVEKEKARVARLFMPIRRPSTRPRLVKRQNSD